MKADKKNQVKMIGGTHRGRNIIFVDSEGLRPTPARVRETLFNWLGQDLTGLTILDLFAGSGVLGFEAASRGAKEVVMVERASQVVKTLCKNNEKLSFNNVTITKNDALQFLSHSKSKQFDVVFLDPPYAYAEWIQLLSLLKPLLAEDAFVYIEAAQQPEFEPDFVEVKSGKAGQSKQWLVQINEEI